MYNNQSSVDQKQAKLKSIVDYAAPLYMGETELSLNRLESVYMYINRLIRGGYTFMVNKVKICEQIKVDLPRMALAKTAVTYLHNHIRHKLCDSLTGKLVIPKRIASIMYTKRPQNGTYPASLDKIVNIYNKLPANVKTLRIGPFKRYLKKNDIKLN